MMENELSRALSASINTEVSSIATDALEIGLDSIIENNVTKEIPFLSTTISIYKIGRSIKERYYLKKLSTFIFEVNKGIRNEKNRKYYRDKITANPKKRKKEIEYILLLVDRYLQTKKTKMLAKLYLSYLDREIKWDDFTKYAEVIDRFLPGDYEMLLSDEKYKTEYDLETDSIQRLIALGLVIEGFRTMATQEEDGTLLIEPPAIKEKSERNYSRTEFGNTLVTILGHI